MTSGSNVSTELTLATNYVIEQLHKVNEEKIDKARTFQNNLNWILATIASVLLLGWLFMKWLFATRIQYMIDIISYLKLIHNSETKTEINERVLLKSISKPKEIEELLLTKLTKFETGEKFLNKDMSLALLASQLDTNTKYLSEVINKYKGKNFNVYINELRINYIVSKLKTNPMYLNYKVSYLADECGFSSHSSFSTVFKNCTGIKPNVFIQFLMKDRNENNKSSAA
ncbi:MAG TPA: AraC family transcriptional regulator, partial [Flavobacterium sp.]|nr:AraC family transcriptional regulator [Flavobacterium sp.]